MENLIYERLQSAKRENVVFNETPSLFTLVSDEKNLLEHFINPNEVSFIEYNRNLYYSLDKAIIVTIPLKKGQIQLELLEVPTSFYNYKVVTSDGNTLPSRKDIKHYRGVVKDDPNSIVGISFLDNEVMGVIATDEGNFNLGLDSEQSKHIFYNEKNLNQKMKFECGSYNDGLSNYNRSVLFQKSKSAILSNDVCVLLYFETEYDIFQTRGSVGAVEGFVAAVFNQVATLYQNENIETRLSEIFVWNTPDPYTATDTNLLLTQFKSYRTTLSGDLGQLLVFRPGSGGGDAGTGFNGLCNPSIAEKLCVSRIYNSYELIPIYSWTVFVIAHEFGHLFGSKHTHACVWNGNNTAIDGCAGYTEDGLCALPPNPSGGGTIMSYCYDTSVGVNFTLGFGLQPGNVIRNSVANADCLCECIDSVITGPDYICISGVYSIADLPSGATVTGWSADPSSLVNISGSGTSVTVSKVGPYTPDPRPVTLFATLSTDCGTMTVQRQVSIGTINPNITDINISGGPGHEGYLCEHAIGFNTYELVLNPSGPVDGPFVLELLSYPGGAVLHSQQVNLATGILPFTWF